MGSRDMIIIMGAAGAMMDHIEFRVISARQKYGYNTRL